MKKSLINWFGLLGIIGLLLYVMTVVWNPLAMPCYNWMAQSISDLHAFDTPSKLLWSQLSSVCSICQIVTLMMVCVYIQNRLNTTMRVGIYVFTSIPWIASVGEMFFPLSNSEYIGTMQAIMPGNIVGILVILLLLVSLSMMTIGGYRYKQYRTLARWACIAFCMVVLGAIGMVFMPTAYFGIFERLCTFAPIGFTAVLGVYLCRGFDVSRIRWKHN